MFLYFTFFSWCWFWMNFPAFPKVNFVWHFPTHNYDHKYIFTHTACLFFFTFSSNFTRIGIFTKDEQNYKLYKKAKGNPNVYKSLKHTYILCSSSSPVYRQHIYKLSYDMDMWSHRSLTAIGCCHEGPQHGVVPAEQPLHTVTSWRAVPAPAVTSWCGKRQDLGSA